MPPDLDDGWQPYQEARLKDDWEFRAVQGHLLRNAEARGKQRDALHADRRLYLSLLLCRY